jgi:diguanylate cyclase (GGDEF)-like protein
MYSWIAWGGTAAGIVILALSIGWVRRLMAVLPASQTRRRWRLLLSLILVFIAGYGATLIHLLVRPVGAPDLVVSGVFVGGAGFVLLVARLSHQTATDLRRMAALEVETITDPLMAIHNRRYFDRRLDEEVARASRYRLPLSLLLVDLDHFKRINDLHGHQTGDEVLRRVAGALMGGTRKSDIVARYGGEELAVLAPSTSGAGAAVLAERLREQVESMRVANPSQAEGGVEVRCTVSVGVAELCEDASEGRSLVAAADSALYRAKAEGRNRVVLAAPTSSAAGAMPSRDGPPSAAGTGRGSDPAAPR